MNHPLIICFHIKKKSQSHTTSPVQRNTDDSRLKGMVRAVPWQQLRPQEWQRAMFAWSFPEFMGKPLEKTMVSRMLNVWYIYLQNWVFFGANVGKYSIHGAYGFRRKC